MKKRYLAIALIFILLISFTFVLAQDETDSDSTTDTTDSDSTDDSIPASELTDYSDKINKAYSCLENKVEDKDNCKTMNAEEQALAILALGYDADSQRNCRRELLDNSNKETCWPATGCKIRDTALAALALDYIGADTSDPVNWLISKNATPTNLVWYLQIDTNERATCTITYEGSEHIISVEADKKLNRDAGSCLSRGQDNYWFEVDSSCYNTKFVVSCDKDFLTNLLYKRQGSSTIYVSSSTSVASADGQTEEKVTVKCLKQGAQCDYEGTLWATLAFSKTSQDISSYIPYLSATAGDNENFFPDSLLYVLTAEEVYFTNVLDEQKPGKYWQVENSPYNKFYDTALALLALYNSNTEALSKAQSYLFTIQSNDGCWQGIRDTSFLLFAGWPRAPVSVDSDINYCSDASGYCASIGECADVSGERLEDYDCLGGYDICCSKQPVQKLCSEKGGEKCTSDESCSGSRVSSLDSDNCCLNGICEEVRISDCAAQGNTCKSSCGDKEEAKSATCPGLDYCCGDKEGGWGWIWILIILIILVVLAIIFREKLKIYWFQIKSKFKKSPSSSQPNTRFPPRPSPQMMGRMPMRPMRPMSPGRMLMRPGRMPIRGKAPSANKTELEDTLKKLKDISK